MSSLAIGRVLDCCLSDSFIFKKVLLASIKCRHLHVLAAPLLLLTGKAWIFPGIVRTCPFPSVPIFLFAHYSPIVLELCSSG